MRRNFCGFSVGALTKKRPHLPIFYLLDTKFKQQNCQHKNLVLYSNLRIICFSFIQIHFFFKY